MLHKLSPLAIGVGLACCLAITVTLVAAFNCRPMTLMFDENYYYPLAEKISNGIFEDGYVVRPPLYPLFLAGIFGIFGKGFTAILIIQSIIRGLTVGLVGWLGRKYFNPKVGIAAATILAFYPLMIWTYTRFVSECIYLPMFIVSFAMLDRSVHSQNARESWAAGLATGLATLIRSTSFFFTLVVAFWLAVRKTNGKRFSRIAVRNALLLLIGMITVISPWTIRNAVTHKTLILVDNTTPFNLWLITSGEGIRQVEKEWLSYPSHGERQREGYRRWLAYLQADPLFHLRRLPKVVTALFNPARDPSLNSLAVIIRGSQVHRNRIVRKALGIVVPFWLVLLTAGGILGVIALEKDRSRRDLVIVLVVFFVLLHGMTLARPRFLLPMNMVLSIYAGATVLRVLSRSGLTRRNPPLQS